MWVAGTCRTSGLSGHRRPVDLAHPSSEMRVHGMRAMGAACSGTLSFANVAGNCTHKKFFFGASGFFP